MHLPSSEIRCCRRDYNMYLPISAIGWKRLWGIIFFVPFLGAHLKIKII